MKTLFYILPRDGTLIARFTNRAGKRRTKSTGLIPRKWHQKLQYAEGDSKINELIGHWKRVGETSFTFDQLFKKIDVRNDVMLSELIPIYCKNRTHLSSGSIEKYNGFVNILGDHDVVITKIDTDYINRLYTYFLTRMNQNSAHNRMKQLTFFMNYAVENELIKFNPLNGMKFKKPEVVIEYLTEEEIEVMASKTFFRRLAEVRDVFLFQCYTAMEYSRLETFSTKIHIDGRLWIQSQRKKTKKEAVLPMFPRAMEIWQRYDQSLPIKANQKMNAYLKEIQDICSIEKKLHTHLARHTFATTVCLLNGVSAESTAKMMGISVNELIKTYGKIVDKKVAKETDQFFNIRDLGIAQ